MNESVLPLFDHPRRPSIEVIDGVPTLVTDRHHVEDLAVIEPVDARTDSFAAVPLRSAWHDACGPSFEFGPFELSDSEAITLHNALLKHVERFPESFRRVGGSA